jgi:tetratricopeptide (TPR) repeat protein
MAAVIACSLMLVGCSRSSFLGRQFDDLTAKYNTYYNANRTYEEQERRLRKEDEPVNLDRYLLVFQVQSVTGRSAELEKVIQKSADLLRKHPESKWVDDALMLIGKSYFHQAQYVGAEQKFNEVIALGSDRYDEAIFWLARTLVASQSQQAAEDLIRTALSSDRLKDKWRPRLHLLLGDLRTDFGDWEGAIAALEAGLEDIDDGDLAARAQFLLGQLHETVGDYEASANAYRLAAERKPLYELWFAAMYSYYRVEGLYGDPEIALAGLQKMLRDNKHFQYYDRIEYNRARVYGAAGDPIASTRILRGVLYPPPGRRSTSIRGEIHYRLGELNRDLTGDFVRAAAHFDTAATSLRTNPSETETYTPDAIVDARELARMFDTYRDVKEEVREMDSLLYLGSLDDEAFDQAVREVRERLAIEARRIAEEMERRQTRTSFQRFGGADATPGAQQAAAARQQRGRFGFLNHKDLQLVQEAFINFRREWGDRPLIPGWRREEVVVSTRSGQQDELDKVEGTVQVQQSGGALMNFLPPVDVSNVPRDSVSRAKMRSRRSAAHYKLANVLFLSMGLPASRR